MCICWTGVITVEDRAVYPENGAEGHKGECGVGSSGMRAGFWA